MNQQPSARPPPARGVKAGIKADLQALKDATQAGYVAGPGTTAWSHDFLNKKPWHPSNFKNQIRKYEAEQEVALRAKREEAAKAEFESEQRYLTTLAHLPSAEADKYRARQGVAWMYVKPPGMSAAEEKAQQQTAEAARQSDQQKSRAKTTFVADACRPLADASSAGAPSTSGRPAASGTQDSQGWNLGVKRKERSPPRGGFDWSDVNQQFIPDLDVSDEPVRERAAKDADRAPSHKRRRRDKEAKDEEGKSKRRTKKDKAKNSKSVEDKKLRRAVKLLLKEGINVGDVVASGQPVSPKR